MQMSQRDLIAWEAVAAVLAEEEPAEWEMLPEIVESIGSGGEKIGDQPGGFDIGGMSLQASALFALVGSILTKMAPKIFDAALDVGKDVLKKRFEKKLGGAAAVPAGPVVVFNLNSSELRASVHAAAAKRGMSRRTADRLADALLVALLDAQARTPNHAPET